jgi:phosphatidate cytidylyltransferase
MTTDQDQSAKPASSQAQPPAHPQTPPGSKPATGQSEPKAASELTKRVISGILLVVAALLAAFWGDRSIHGLTYLRPFSIFWYIAGIAVFYEWLNVIGCSRKKAIFAFGAVLLAYPALLQIHNGPPLQGTIFLEDAMNRMREPMPQFLSAANVIVGLSAGALTFLALRESGKTRLWMLFGLLYAGLLIITVPYIRNSADAGLVFILWLFGVVWATDIGAYFTGISFGGPKLWPRVSPKKTWSGFFGGLFFGTLTGVVVLQLAVFYGVSRIPGSILADHIGSLVLYSLAGAFCCEIGDLAESAFKRYFNVKDSGRIIPGHGGVMDRVDGLWATALLFSILLFFTRH